MKIDYFIYKQDNFFGGFSTILLRLKNKLSKGNTLLN